MSTTDSRRTVDGDHAMTDPEPSAADEPLLPPATAEVGDETVAPVDSNETNKTSVTDSVDVLVKSFISLFRRTPEIDLETIRERTTVRNVVDYSTIDEQLDPGWAVSPEIVKFGEEPLADALVFSHYERSYDVILKPADIFLPTDEIELFIFDRERGIRHQLIQTTPTLDDALAHTVLQLTHSLYNPDAPYLASLISDETVADDELPEMTTE